MAADADLNLSGHWQGVYSYPIARPMVPFDAHLAETDGWLIGATQELSTRRPSAGQLLTATLQGRREGRSVRFLKTYDAALQGFDAVQYVGDLRDDGSEIDGLWTIPGGWSGRFLMIRSSWLKALAERKVTAEV